MAFRDEIHTILKRQDNERSERKERQKAAAKLASPEHHPDPDLILLRQQPGSKTYGSDIVVNGTLQRVLHVGTDTSDSDLQPIADKLSISAKDLGLFRSHRDAFDTPLVISNRSSVTREEAEALRQSLKHYPGFEPRLFGNWVKWRIRRTASNRADAEILRRSMPSPSAELDRMEPFLRALDYVRSGLETNILSPMNDDRDALIDPSAARKRLDSKGPQVPLTAKDDGWSDMVEVALYTMRYLSSCARQVQRELRGNMRAGGRPVTPFYRDLLEEIQTQLRTAPKPGTVKVSRYAAENVLKDLGAERLIGEAVEKIRGSEGEDASDPGSKEALNTRKRALRSDPRIKIKGPKPP